ncbi:MULTISPECIES: hypothetical protein [unclassified Arthrobacter]|uniref:hypothetical protein n=1 Tax=unclassified Arthrobacter TaxID=235627 RepID=UPI000CE4DAD5|nr:MULTISPECIES: hypothetical protein [unclassified Arthrobacter]
MIQRKSSAMLEARERARKAAAASMARQERLLKLGERFFVAVSDEDQIRAAGEDRIRELRAKVEADTEKAKIAQANVVIEMKTEGLSVSEIAQRLDLTSTGVRSILGKSKPAAGTVETTAGG